MPDAKSMDDGFNLSHDSIKKRVKFVIEFNEDGSPIHCHNVITDPPKIL